MSDRACCDLQWFHRAAAEGNARGQHHLGEQLQNILVSSPRALLDYPRLTRTIETLELGLSNLNFGLDSHMPTE